MTGRPGRPRADRLAQIEQIAQLLDEQPDLSIRQIASQLRIRTEVVTRELRVLRGRTERFPNPERPS
jgi:hypothetical protein